jgi:hypothetical protein
MASLQHITPAMRVAERVSAVVSRKQKLVYTDRLSPRTPRTTRCYQPLGINEEIAFNL